MTVSGGDMDYEKLFLVEVLVDSVQFSQSKFNLLKDVLTKPGSICVCFQFLHFPPLKVCETDFAYIPGTPDFSNIVFKSGKSCLFSLRSSRCPVMPMAFDIHITVEKSMWQHVDSDEVHDSVLIGKTTIGLGESFTRLMNADTDQNADGLPTAKIKKDIFSLKDSTDSIVGNISLFVRLSCFGKLIITQFQVKNEDPDLVLFKGTNYPSIFKPSICQSTKYEVPASPSIAPGHTLLENESRRSQLNKEEGLMHDGLMHENRLSKGLGREFTESWRVQKQTVPYRDDITQVMEMSEYKSYTKYEVAPDTNYDLDLPAGSVGMKDSQVIFQMQKQRADEKDKKTSPVYYKLSATDDSKQKKNVVQIIPQDTTAGSTPGNIPPAEDQDVFVLRIGQKSEGCDKKSKLELELRTPKIKEPKPETNSVDTQYPEIDGRGASPKGKKKGGKGKKGKKGKKSKK